MSLSKQTSLNTIATVAMMMAQWLISVLLVRIDGFEAAGIYSLAMSMSNVFSAVANYGIRAYQVTDVSGVYRQKSYLVTRLITGGIAASLCLGYRLVTPWYSTLEYGAILLYLVYLIVNYISDSMMGSLQMQGKLEINAYSNFMRSTICFSGFLVTFLISKQMLLSLTVMIAGSVSVTVFYDLPRYRPCWETGKGPVAREVKALLWRCFPLMMSLILPLLTTAIPRNAIQKLLGNEALGYFSSIYTPTVLLITLIPSALVAITPEISKAWQNKDWNAFLKYNAICYGGVIGLSILALLAALVAGKPVMKLVFGEGILTYYNLLYWAIFAMGVSSLSSCLISVFNAMQKNMVVMLSTAVAAVAACLLSEFMVKGWGIYGASYALLAAYSLQTMLLFGCLIVFSRKIRK